MSNYYAAGCHALYNRQVPIGDTVPVKTVPEGCYMEGGKIKCPGGKEHIKDKLVAIGSLAVIGVVAFSIFGGKS